MSQTKQDNACKEAGRIHPDELDLRPLKALSSQQVEQVRLLRNLPEISDMMINNHCISRQEHQAWYDRMVQTGEPYFYGVFYDDRLVGTAALQNYDPAHARSSWAIYLDPKVQGSGIGSALEFAMLELFFQQLKGQKLSCEVLETNESALSFYQNFGFQEEGFLREHVLRDDKRIGLHLLGLTRKEWVALKPTWQARFDALKR